MNLFLSCLLLGLSLVANASDKVSMTVNPTQGGFVVKLNANPTTGFQWKIVRFDKKILTLTNSQYHKPQTNRIGAGGQMFFTFSLNKSKNYPDKTNIVFKYARPWETNSGTIKNVTVNFIATPTN